MRGLALFPLFLAVYAILASGVSYTGFMSFRGCYPWGWFIDNGTIFISASETVTMKNMDKSQSVTNIKGTVNALTEYISMAVL